MSQFGLSIVGITSCLSFGVSSQEVYHSSENSQALVDLASLFQPLTLGLRVFDTLTASQIDHVELGRSNRLLVLDINSCHFDIGCEDGMRPRRFSVHVGACHRSVDLPFVDECNYILERVHDDLRLVLKYDSFFGILTYLKLCLLGHIKKIMNVLVVNLRIRAHNFERDLLNIVAKLLVVRGLRAFRTSRAG